jgi:adenylate cyclase class IV
MRMETEITVLVKTDYNSLKKALEVNGFEEKEEYELNDNYMISKDVDLSKLTNLEILGKCILVRDIVNIKKVLLYKYKKFDSNGDILEQGKVECPITDIDKAIKFMEAINYKKLFHIYDKCITFANSESELTVQLVNDKYIFIEMEASPEFINRKYESVEELKNDINRYNLPIDNSNYFVKKAELMLEEVLD